MDSSDEDFLADEDYEDSDDSQVLSEDEDELPMEEEPHESTSHERHVEDFTYEFLSADQIVEFMINCIKEVNAVVQVSRIAFGFSNLWLLL